jgi:hypothetical protein
MLLSAARSSAIMLMLVAIVAPVSEAQARHWGHWGHWGSFGYRGQWQYEGHIRSSANEDGTNDWEPRERAAARYGGFNNRASPLGTAVAELIKACAAGAEDLQHWPNESIAQAIAPDESQRGILEQVRGDAAKQAEILRAACPRDMPADPVARVDVSATAADAMLAAVNAVEPSVQGFYAQLGDEQKARLVALRAQAGNANDSTRRVRRWDRRAREPEAAPDRSGFAGVCDQWGRALLDWPRRRIDRGFRLNDAQQAALHDLIDSSNHAADALAKSCPADRSLTPVGHLQTMREQLASVGQAIQAVRPALGHFYETLDDEQRLRFALTN